MHVGVISIDIGRAGSDICRYSRDRIRETLTSKFLYLKLNNYSRNIHMPTKLSDFITVTLTRVDLVYTTLRLRTHHVGHRYMSLRSISHN
jgi:hypothetical protein